MIGRNPFLADALLARHERSGKRDASARSSPSLVHNTVDNPIFPTTGRRFTAQLRPRRPRRQHQLLQAAARGHPVLPADAQLSVGFRAQFEFVAPWRDTLSLPIFERLVLGGEYSVRGYDIRTIGPRDHDHGRSSSAATRACCSTASTLIQIAGPVRCWCCSTTPARSATTGRTSASDEFVASTGAEVRFFMPVLNVPFRLIFARNINYEGILDNNYQPEKKWRFRFAVGSTF